MVTEAVIIQKDQQKIPSNLIKEIIEGIPFYYKGYKEVINQTKKLEDIMPDSGLQSFIKRYLFLLLVRGLDPSKFEVFMGEVGSHLEHNNNLGLDVAIYDKEKLTPEKITKKYIDVVPKLVIEVDVNVEMEDKTSNLFEDFIIKKVRNLHKHGTEKVVWIFTKSKTVIVALPDNNWKVVEWDEEVELQEGVTFNIGKHLKDNNIQL